jgi:hypothetical protein
MISLVSTSGSSLSGPSPKSIKTRSPRTSRPSLINAVALERALKSGTRIRSTSSSSIGEPRQLRTRQPSPVDTLLTRLNLSPRSYAADKGLLFRAATVPAESKLLIQVNRAIASLYPLFATYEHSELDISTFPPRRRTIVGGYSSQSPAVRGPFRTLST